MLGQNCTSPRMQYISALTVVRNHHRLCRPLIVTHNSHHSIKPINCHSSLEYLFKVYHTTSLNKGVNVNFFRTEQSCWCPCSNCHEHNWNYTRHHIIVNCSKTSSSCHHCYLRNDATAGNSVVVKQVLFHGYTRIQFPKVSEVQNCCRQHGHSAASGLSATFTSMVKASWVCKHLMFYTG